VLSLRRLPGRSRTSRRASVTSIDGYANDIIASTAQPAWGGSMRAAGCIRLMAVASDAIMNAE
jgi:hypothetical protein